VHDIGVHGVGEAGVSPVQPMQQLARVVPKRDAFGLYHQAGARLDQDVVAIRWARRGNRYHEAIRCQWGRRVGQAQRVEASWIAGARGGEHVCRLAAFDAPGEVGRVGVGERNRNRAALAPFGGERVERRPQRSCGEYT
jgi:hypothetical protein